MLDRRGDRDDTVMPRPSSLSLPLGVALAAVVAVSVSAAADDPASEPAAAARLPALFIIGDSTVNNHTAGQVGWGDPIAGLFDPTRVQVLNRARGGRSSRTYLTE